MLLHTKVIHTFNCIIYVVNILMAIRHQSDYYNEFFTIMPCKPLSIVAHILFRASMYTLVFYFRSKFIIPMIKMFVHV